MTITRLNPEYAPKNVVDVQRGTLTSGYGTFVNDSYRWCRRSGNVVQFYAYLRVTAATTAWGTGVVQLPAGFRPSGYTLMPFALGSQGSVTGNVLGAVGADGMVSLGMNLAVGNTIQLGGTFVV